jgi:hypothetical protein
VATGAAPRAGRCESCGDQATDLTTVRRLYITPEDWDRERQVRPAADPEDWCFVCLTMYPHELL